VPCFVVASERHFFPLLWPANQIETWFQLIPEIDWLAEPMNMLKSMGNRLQLMWRTGLLSPLLAATGNLHYAEFGQAYFIKA
jgi:hypothetical protein